MGQVLVNYRNSTIYPIPSPTLALKGKTKIIAIFNDRFLFYKTGRFCYDQLLVKLAIKGVYVQPYSHDAAVP